MAKLKKRSDGRYCKNVTVGRNEDGSLRRKMIYANTQKELDLKVAELTLQVDKGIIIDDKGMTVGEWAKKWYESYVEKTTKAHNTKIKYENIVFNHIIPCIGYIKIKDLKQYQVQNMFNEKEQDGFTKTIELMKLTLNQILEQAVENDYIYKNVAKGVRIKSYKAPEKQPLTDEQINKIKNTNHSMHNVILFLIYTGMRIGEAVALTWADVDFKNKIIHVTKTADFYNDEANTKTPKTTASIRDIPIVEPLYKILECMFKETESIYVFSYNGNMFKHGTLDKRKLYYCKKLGFDFTFHQCRHTCATMLYNAGVGIKEAQNWLGHANIKTTMDVYTHLDKKNKESALSKMNEMLLAK
ncbi:site-specific integrase [Sedimentibacter hydroxybenzoicus DSM 7310]|uniref:Site-specific integrase n=1 Tax=Sedimentibacter hydroxybenzoicus DSM 7310 TaxID=1123245 RepID=A0A974BHR5_SEDHY|nr:site-specific integrase [Sedimentibacter hydroxybenzoicus]NYB73414.1 site-specific integrase [Sedimentibacter hydroxybenzoicus DSM 7310]